MKNRNCHHIVFCADDTYSQYIAVAIITQGDITPCSLSGEFHLCMAYLHLIGHCGIGCIVGLRIIEDNGKDETYSVLRR